MSIRGATYLAVDELDVVRALGVAVAGTVLGAGDVAGEAGLATVSVHLNEVEGAIETTGQVRHVDVEGELLVLQLEHLVGGLVRHQVDTRADIAARDKLERERVTAGCDTVGARVVCAVEGTVLRTSGGVGADARVPRIAGVAVGVAASGVQPTPVGVENDGSAQGLASAGRRALLRGQLRVVLGGLSSSLLSVCDGEQGESDEGGGAEHSFGMR